MGTNLNSRGARGIALSTRNRKLSRSGLLLASLLMLCLASLQSTASAQTCAQQCQQQYVACLRSGLGIICDDMYDVCLSSCVRIPRQAAFSINRPSDEKSPALLSPPASRFTGTGRSRKVLDNFGMLWLVKDFSIDGKTPHQKCLD